jgi:transcription elongation GreA/GreB family factor
MKPNEALFPGNAGWEREDLHRERRAAKRAPRARTLEVDDQEANYAHWESHREGAEQGTTDDCEIPKSMAKTVGLEAPVLVLDLDTNEEITFTVVDCDAADPSVNRISFASPVGMALLWRRVGDKVRVAIPNGQAHYQIIGLAGDSANL